MLTHLTTPADWAAAQRAGDYRADSLDTQGFIHLSSPHQLLLAANTHYRHRDDLVVLIIDEAALDPVALVFEAGSPPNTHLIFPHLYGPLPLAAVREVVAFPCEADGTFRWPAALGETPA